jgi:hypothetical protein
MSSLATESHSNTTDPPKESSGITEGGRDSQTNPPAETLRPQRHVEQRMVAALGTEDVSGMIRRLLDNDRCS